MGLVVGGILYLSFLMPLFHRLPSSAAVTLLPFSGWNCYAPVLQNLLFPHPYIMLVINAALLILTGILIISPKPPNKINNVLYGPAVPLLCFLLNPLILARTTAGFQGEPLFIPLFLTAFIAIWSGMASWSDFMRAIIFSLLCMTGVWIYVPAVVWVLEAMIPWIFFNRRPFVALWTWLAAVVGGTVLFTASWYLFGLLSHGAAAFNQPYLEALRYLTMGTVAGSLLRVVEIFSPFGIILLVWKASTTFKRMVYERRAGIIEFSGFLTFLLAWLNMKGEDYPVSLAAVGFLFLGMVFRREARPSQIERRLEAFLISGMAIFFLLRDIALWRG